jgi:uncharacterized membrane protein
MRPNSLKNPTLSYIEDNKLILLIILIGLIVRLYNLGEESFWFDEVYSIDMARRSLVGIVKAIINESDNNPPLFYMIMHYWVKLFGISEFSFRLPSTIISSFSVLIIYKLGKLLFNRNIGLFAALLLAISVLNISYAQEARAYSLMVFLALLSLYFFFQLIAIGKRSYTLGYIVTSILLIYTHYYGLFLIAALNTYYFIILIINRKVGELGFKRWVLIQLILLISFLPGILLIISSIASINKEFWIEIPKTKEMLDIYQAYSSSRALFIIFTLWSVIGIINYSKIKDIKSFINTFISVDGYSSQLCFSNIERVTILILIFIFLNIIPFIISHFFLPIYTLRYTVIASSAYYLLVAKGFDNIGNKKLVLFNNNILLTNSLIISLIIIISFFHIHQYYHTPLRHSWREAIEYIDTNADDQDIVMICPPTELRSAKFYNKRKKLKISPLSDESELITNTEGKRIWVVISDLTQFGDQISKETLVKHYNLLSEKDFFRLHVYVLADNSRRNR